MEEKKEVEIKTKSPMWLVILVAVLVIALGCEFVYVRKLKQAQAEPQVQPDQQQAVVIKEENNKTEIETEEKSSTQTSNSEKLSILSNADKKELEETISNYYKLFSKKKEHPIAMLTDVLKLTVYGVQDPEYAPKNYFEHKDPTKYTWTGIKYSDFKNELWYINDDVLKEKFYEFVEYKDYLFVDDHEKEQKFNYKIVKNELEKVYSLDKCTYKVTVEETNSGKTATEKITLARGNGNFVILSVE